MPDQRMWETDLVFEAQRVRRIDGDTLAVLFEYERLFDTDVVARSLQLNDPRLPDGFRIGQCAAVEDRNLEIVEFDNGIVDTQAVERRKQVLDRGNPDATAHQRRGIGDPCDRTDIRPKFEIVEIDAPEDDALSGRSWKNTHRGSLTGVQADSAELNGG